MVRINIITKSLFLLFLFFCPGIASQDSYPDSIAIRISELEQAVEELNNKIFQQEKEDEFKKLMDEADRLSTMQEDETIDISKKYFSGVRQQQGLNPNISFGVDFFTGKSTSDNHDISEANDIFYGNNGFHLREAQLSLVAPLDPFTTFLPDWRVTP